jgi:acetyltransferase-like isoleucine patch superfamily enzyme
MIKKIRYLRFIINWLCLSLNKPVKSKGIAFIENDVEFIFGKNSSLIIGRRVYVRKNCVISVGDNAILELGDNVFLAHGVTIASQKEIRIGNHTMIAEYCSVRDHDHSISGKNAKIQPVFIGKKVWLANKVTVTKGVNIGDSAVIGANSVVTKNIPAGKVAVGISARVRE